MSALSQMYADAAEFPLVVVMMVLPTVFSMPAALRGARAGLVAPTVLGAQLLVWFLFYATGASSGWNGMGVALLPLPFTWATTGIAWLGLRHNKASSTPTAGDEPVRG